MGICGGGKGEVGARGRSAAVHAFPPTWAGCAGTMALIMGALKCKLWSSEGLNTLVAEDLWTNIKGGSGLFKTILEMKNS